MVEERTLQTYEVVRSFWRTTEAFDTVRERMPPEGVFLKDGYAYFVSQAIAVRVPIPIKRIDLFVRPDLRAIDDGWGEREDLLARTERGHPYQDLGPRPRHFHPLFAGDGATLHDVHRLFQTEDVSFTVRLDRDALRGYLSETAGPRGNGRSGFLAVTVGETAEARYVYTQKQGEPSWADHGVALDVGGGWHGTFGISPYALNYALRFLHGEVTVHVGTGRVSLTDRTNGNRVVLAVRDTRRKKGMPMKKSAQAGEVLKSNT